MKLALLDADAFAFRSAAACENESADYAVRIVDHMIISALLYCDDGERYYDKWKLFLTPEKGNFRYEVAKTHPYKGNRKGEKPQHLQAVRQHLVDEWNASIAENQEADDDIAIAATECGLDNVVIIAVDKDFNQLSCHHYNFVKRQHFYPTPDEALRYFYMQVLMGDKVDNIIGIRGIGPVKAAALLSGATTECEMYDVCVKAYGDVDRVNENATLLFLRRKVGQIWTPPK